nr:NADH dehydrogenase subunit 6 [Stipomorpha sp.]
MIQFTINLLMLMMGFLFMQMNHPLTLGLILLIQTILIVSITGMMSKTFWFSYILFLIFIGGMLILFIYMTSIASNEMFSISKKPMIYLLLFMLTMMMMYMLMNKMMMFYMNNNEINSLINLNSYMKENNLNLMKLYNYPINMLTILMINYLLITMIISVKITKLFYGPIRSSF